MSKNNSKTKTQFRNTQIRTLSDAEQILADKVFEVINEVQQNANIATIPRFVSKDMEKRPLVLHKDIIDKIVSDHGNILIENLIINANDWDVVIKNVDRNVDKINLIKLIPDSDNYFVIGANRDNGYFLLTHYEVISKAGNELESLLGRGDFLDKNGFPLEPPY